MAEERRAVWKALLELDCIPAGMEMFPASSDDQWTLIQRVIDDCDYYLVIVGGRYGSLDQTGISFTEREYDYALARETPVMGFLHKDPDSLPVRQAETDQALAGKLSRFRRSSVRRSRARSYWRSKRDS